MKESQSGINRAALLLMAALAGVTSLEERAMGQRSRSSAPSVDRRMERINRQGEEYERDKLRGELNGRPVTSSDRRRAEALAILVRQDFEGLQTGYNQIVLAMASHKPLSNEAVLAAVADIKKCSSRLKSKLALPRQQNDQDKKAISDGDTFAREGLEGSLLMLRKHIYSFVMNPLFEAPTVLDVVQAKKASDDLEMVIELSERIGKSSEKLKKLNRSRAIP